MCSRHVHDVDECVRVPGTVAESPSRTGTSIILDTYLQAKVAMDI